LCGPFACSAIYAIGGQNETDILDSVERYDIGAGTWTVVCRLPQPLRCITAVSCKGNLYVFGGENRTVITKTAYR
jgi:N-acetylneuraminic acid mutarotase